MWSLAGAGVVLMAYRLREAIYQHSTYSRTITAVWAYLADRSSIKHGYSWVGVKTMAHDLRVGVRSVQYALRKLEADRRIEAVADNKGGHMQPDSKGRTGRTTRWKVNPPDAAKDAIVASLEGLVCQCGRRKTKWAKRCRECWDRDRPRRHARMQPATRKDATSDTQGCKAIASERTKETYQGNVPASSATPKVSRARDGLQPASQPAEITESKESTGAVSHGVLPMASGAVGPPPCSATPPRPCAKCGLTDCGNVCGKCGQCRPRYRRESTMCRDCTYRVVCQCGGLKSKGRKRCRACWDRERLAA